MAWLALIGFIGIMVSSSLLVKRIKANTRPYRDFNFKSYFLSLPEDIQQSYIKSLDNNSKQLFEFYLHMVEDPTYFKEKPLYLSLRLRSDYHALQQLDLELHEEMQEQFNRWVLRSQK